MEQTGFAETRNMLLVISAHVPLLITFTYNVALSSYQSISPLGLRKHYFQHLALLADMLISKVLLGPSCKLI